MLQSRLYRDGRPVEAAPELTEDASLDLGDADFLWVDVRRPDDADLELLRTRFGVHPLILEDIRHQHQRPKVELYQDLAFVVLRPLALAEGQEPQEQELHALVGRRFLVTIRHEPAFEMDEVRQRWERDPELLASGGGFAVYVLVDEVVDGYLTLVEQLEDEADDLEDEIFASQDGAAGRLIQERLFKLKRACVRLRRFAMPLRQGLDLIQEQPQIATTPLAPYYRDVMDHVIRTTELADNVRDLLTSMLEVRVAQTANHMNEAMKKMTAWAGIILVPTLIAGIYGMNFQGMPELGWHLGYPLALGAMAASAVILYAVFKRKEWL